jgi:hypothetical protein
MCLNETYSKVRVGKHLSDSFLIQNGAKQGDALSPLFLSFSLEYAVRKVQETRQVWNWMRPIIDSIQKNTLVDASKEVGLEINMEKIVYMLLPRHKNASQNQDIKIANWSFENVSQFKYLGKTVTNQNLI